MAERTLLIRLPAIVGPTASGKTALAIALANRLGGEIISCDSMQIYRHMDIGTAKPTEKERAAVPHHLIDFLEPNVPYSAAAYAQDARRTAEDILSRGKLPVFCGGTGLYLSAAARGAEGDGTPGETEHRAVLEAIAKEPGGIDRLWEELFAADPESAEATHKNNVRRVIRALEIYRATGIPKSEWDRRTRAVPPAMYITPFMIDYPDREVLYRRIENRVDAMIAEGLVEEARGLYERGLLSPDSTAGQAIGYKEIATHLRGEVTLEAAVAELKTATRRYAKRQLTWFCAQKDLIRLSPVSEDGHIKTPEELGAEAEAIFRALPPIQ